ncbi:MAG: GNAT family N-acetyltransferase, partial [Actinomycetota bacterium]|nr:GNAT family N-acetyltransferase [Actinomycetota bacterium]
MNLAGALLERAARATPAAVETRKHGWWLRHTDGSSWWSGAVLAHDCPAASDLAERIEVAEHFYADLGAAVLFQVCPGCPAELDRVLADRGYRWDSPISLQATTVAKLVKTPPAPGLDVRVDSQPDRRWLAVLAATSESRADVANETRLLRRVELPSAYVTVSGGDEPVAIGRAVADDGWTGIFTM